MNIHYSISWSFNKIKIKRCQWKDCKNNGLLIFFSYIFFHCNIIIQSFHAIDYIFIINHAGKYLNFMWFYSLMVLILRNFDSLLVIPIYLSRLFLKLVFFILNSLNQIPDIFLNSTFQCQTIRHRRQIENEVLNKELNNERW